MFHGKQKAVTFSYDDGVTQDKRLIEILNQYGLKATFNLNSELLGLNGAIPWGEKTVSHNKNKPSDVRALYKGHEVAVHTLTHPNLTEQSKEEIIRQVEQDRMNLEKLVGYEIVGMAYPCGGENNNDYVADLLKNFTKIRYARTIKSNYSFDPQDNLLRFDPTVSHNETEKMFELARKFIDLKPDKPQIFYIWGHSYELDIYDAWDKFDAFCKLIGNRNDIFYGTNREILLGC